MLSLLLRLALFQLRNDFLSFRLTGERTSYKILATLQASLVGAFSTLRNWQ